MPRTVEVAADRGALMEAGASAFVAAARAAIGARGRFVTALSGGSTPRTLFELLATGRFASSIEWSRVHVCWGDERAVPPDARRATIGWRARALDHVPIPASQVHRIRGEDPDRRGCLRADAAHPSRRRSVRRVPPGARFDLVLLGMGDNGHTASLFPGLQAVHEAERWVVAERVAEVAMWRITLTPIVLNAAADVLFLVSGADKAAMLHRVLDGPIDPDALPAQIVAPHHGELRWLVDRDAAALLEGR
jgi:6-phosphogluconolactonase